MDLVNKSKYNIILGSGSSRRKELLGMTGINFSVMSIPVDESFPDSLQGTEISEYIVKNKSDAFKKLIKENEIVAVGEIGIDLYWNKSNLALQKKAFLAQIKIAQENDLPIVIHCRNSFNEIFEFNFKFLSKKIIISDSKKNTIKHIKKAPK